MSQVNNHDICGLVRRMDRFVFELHKSVSSNTSNVNVFDIERLSTYIQAINVYHQWLISQPQLDLPESAPKAYEVPEAPALPEVENESVNDVIRLFLIAREEMINAQSARDPAGLNKFDSARLQAIMDKAKAFLDQYINVIVPLDLPESSPMRASSGSGRTGV